MKKLTSKQELFCREYIIDFNATQAAIRAGYKPNAAYAMGHENLSKPEIAEYIDRLKAERAEKVGISAQWVLDKAVELFNKCMEAEPVLSASGENLGYAKFNPSSAAKALELIGKHVNIRAFEGEIAKATNPISIQIVAPDA